MADGRVLRARGQRTRARLLEAGATVLARKGYHAARVDDIVTAARTSHGTFYLYFASKEDLFDQLVAQVAADLTRWWTSCPSSPTRDDGRQALRAWLERFADLYERSGPVIRTWTEAELSTDADRRARRGGARGDDRRPWPATSGCLAGRSSTPPSPGWRS